jgi:outer membrane PBP1 activator LpoA protein
MYKFRGFAYWVWLTAALLLVGGCAITGSSRQQAAPPTGAAYQHAESLYQAGNYRGAARAFRALAKSNPDVRDRALLGAAASNRALGQFQQVSTLLQQVHRGRLGPDGQARYRVLTAEVALHQGQAAAALKTLAELPATIPANIQRHALDVKARAQLAGGHRIAAARTLTQRIALLPGAAKATEQQRVVTILAALGKARLTPLGHSLSGNDPLKRWVEQALGETQTGVARALPRPTNPVGTLGLGSPAPEGYAMPARVALLLPATGPVATAGKAVRDGFFTAYFDASNTREQRPRVEVYDTGGTPQGALAAYRQAVAKGATLVVGPLGQAAVGVVFSQPTLPVPVLALNHPKDTTAVPVGSAEFGLMPEAEGAQLAAHMIEQGLHAAIVFQGDSPTAKRTFNGFKSQFASLGGEVSNDVVLPKGAVDFADQIQAVLAGSGSQTGIVSLLRPEQARLLLPQLRLSRSTLPVFSTSIVYSGRPNPVANGDLDGVVFCDQPWLYNAQAGLPNPNTFGSLLPTASGPAARLFAFGMDAYDLIPYLGWLRTHPGSYLPGATGLLTVTSFGDVQRTPIWVQFHDGSARPVGSELKCSLRRRHTAAHLVSVVCQQKVAVIPEPPAPFAGGIRNPSGSLPEAA